MNLDRKLTRTLLLITIIIISAFIGGLFALKILAPPLQETVSNSAFDNSVMNNDIPENYSKKGFMAIDDACCGHTDTTPPTIQLSSHTDKTTILGGTAIQLFIDDDNPFYDNKASEVLYHWNDDISNTTLTAPEEGFIYEVVPPMVVGTHVLYLYAVDGSDNWASSVFSFTVTSDFDPPTIEFISPSANENLTGMYVFRVNVTDDVGILEVKMRIDTGASYPMSHNLTSGFYERSYNASKFLINGDHNLYITVWDEDSVQHITTESSKFTVFGGLTEAIVSDPPEWDPSKSSLPENISDYIEAGNLESYKAESGEISFKIAVKDDLEIATVDFTIYELDDYDPSTDQPDISDARVELITSLNKTGSDGDWGIYEYSWDSTSATDSYYLCQFGVQDTDEETNILSIEIILQVRNIGDRSSVDFGGPGFELEIVVLTLFSLILITTLIKRKHRK